MQTALATQQSSALQLDQHAELFIVQRREMAEIVLGVETRNKYEILAGTSQVGFAAEQGKGALDFLARMFLGHWRTFEVHVFDHLRNLSIRIVHPFRWFFERMEVLDAAGKALGAIQARFSLLSKRFDVEDPSGKVVLEVDSPLWKPWTFSLTQNGSEFARIEKKWSGIMAETFTDADRFRVVFCNPALSSSQRSLVLAVALFVDIRYFERNSR